MRSFLSPSYWRINLILTRWFFPILLFFLVSEVALTQPVGYSYGKQITIDATEVMGGSPLINYPVMIRLTGADADSDLRTVANGGHVENGNGYDIIFTSDQAGISVLDHQIEFYDGTTGEYVAWVNIPSLDNVVNTDFFMYYGNCAANTNPSTTTTWNSDYDAVYFLHDDVQDATAMNYDGTNNGSTDTSPALIGDGQNFGVNDYVEVPTSSISLAQGTVSIWSYTTTFTGTEQYMYGHTSNPNGWVDRLQLYTDDGSGGLDLGFGNNHNLQQGIVNLSASVWNYIALTWNGTSCTVYVNGQPVHTENYNNFDNLETYLDIGNDGRATGARNEGWDGDLDHARMSNEIFSAEWIETEYNNQRTGSTFLSVGDELSNPITYYSLATGDWDDNNSWSLTPDGSSGALGAGIWPRRYDNVVIQNSHTITIDATDDNNSCGISADALGRSNVGNGADPFTGSGDAMFYQTGNVIVGNGGTLSISEEFMIEGYTLIEDGGTLTATDDVINIGYLEFSATSTFNTTDDLILSGNSVTILDNISTATDDLYIEWTDATLCGNGTFNVGNGSGDPAVQYFNNASIAQVCSDIQVTCTASCSGFPITGTGSFISGNLGLGGVGDLNSLQLWLRADDLSLADGDAVMNWSDASGNGLVAAADGGGGTEPTFEANSANSSLPSISFDDGDYLNLGQPAGLDFVPGTDSWSFFVVYSISDPTEEGTFLAKAGATSGDRTYQYVINNNGSSDGHFSSTIGGNLTNGNFQSNTGAWFVGSHTNNTTTRDSWVNENSNISANGIGTNTTGSVDVLIGARRQTAPTTGFADALNGKMAEIAMYDAEMNEAQRIIVSNYLAAKYGVALSSNDVYAEDDNGYDFEVIGIGQAFDGSNHRDSQGSGVARIWNPADLDNNEFLMIGHDNTLWDDTTSDPSEVDGTVIQERLSRIWSVSETGDVGNVLISIDISAVEGSSLGSNLRLLIDRDGDFSTNDVTPITGTVSGGIAVFSNVDFQDGDRFALGNTDNSSPLPIELLSFDAKPIENVVKITWETATEIDNDHFTIERSEDGNNWERLFDIQGAGNSDQVIWYEAFDFRPLAGVSYYRLKQTDFDGTHSYSSIVFVWSNQGISSVNIYPNPSPGRFIVQSNANLSLDQLQLYDLSGKPLGNHIKMVNQQIIVDLANEPSGIYLLQIMADDQTLGISRLRKE